MASNDTTKLVLGALAGAVGGYLVGPKVAESLFPIGYLPPTATTQEIALYNMHARDRSSVHTATTYGVALAGAVLGGYVGKMFG